MDKRMIICAITAALLGGGLVWAADHRAQDAGIAGWSTLNAGMAQALGVADEGTDGESSADGAAGGSVADGKAVGAGAVDSSGGASGEAAGGGMAGNGAVGGSVAGGASSGVTGNAATGGVTVDTRAGGSVTGNGAAGGNDASAAGSGVVDGAVTNGGTPSNGAATATAGAEATGIAAPAADDGRINVNTADAKALMDLPGIGEKKAQAIIDYRSSKGAFRSANDLGKVKGIGLKLLEKLKPLVTF
ncbi:helix-hairpin-helix domain-containing protein [Paenibacillus sp. FSL H3-0469]|uniref:ComEA family DNA-binding protein n=1 Tax=Paenibacillus sp. FSL H3-0469 TaxID=2954506 RepID=UPI00310175FC